MKSMQVLFICAFAVICSANPIPDEAVAPTTVPVAEVAQPQSTPAVKSADAPVPEEKSDDVPASNIPLTESPSAKSDDKIPEPQALPSKSEESSTAKAEEKKREIQEPVSVEQAKQPVEQGKSVQSTEAVKNEQPVQTVETVTPKALETVSQASEQPPNNEQKTSESVKSLGPESTQSVPEDVVPSSEAKQAAVPAIESTVVPAGIASEKKIDAEAPAPIVSENDQTAVEPELASAPELPAAAAISEQTASPPADSASGSEKKASNESEQDSSSEDSSEESKESDDKKSA